MRIESNSAQFAQRHLKDANSIALKSTQKLASGQRINTAAEDPSGLAISQSMGAQLAISGAEQENVQDTVNLYRVGEGALAAVQDITNRMTELATKAGNETLSQEDRSVLQGEFKRISDEIDRIGKGTTFNGKPVFENAAGGLDSTGGLNMSMLSAAGLGVDNADLSASIGAADALSKVHEAAKKVSSARADLGAAENALSHRYDNMAGGEVDLATSMSRIMDTSVGKEAVNAGIAKALNATSTAMIRNSMNTMHQTAMYHLLW